DPEDHAIFRVDADRESDSFGEVTGEMRTGYVGPCDATLGPEGSEAGDGDPTAEGGTAGDESVRTRSERDAERRQDHPLSDVWGDG
ncbi:ATP-dependent DNA helicase, partial [Halorubrum sp. GN11GM_10-3_MGM]